MHAGVRLQQCHQDIELQQGHFIVVAQAFVGLVHEAPEQLRVRRGRVENAGVLREHMARAPLPLSAGITSSVIHMKPCL